MEIILTDRNYEYWIKGTKNYERFGVLDEMKFLDMFIPNILNNDKYILRGIQDVDNKYNDKVNILLCVENLSVKERRHYSHRNSYGMYGNKCIKIYLYNHISKIVKTDEINYTSNVNSIISKLEKFCLSEDFKLELEFNKLNKYLHDEESKGPEEKSTKSFRGYDSSSLSTIFEALL